jgi:phosphoribosylanthranilate isomerase
LANLNAIFSFENSRNEKPTMWIKICANTNLADAQLAAELGADAVGFVFAPSKRQVTIAEVAHITPHLPAHVERVGVFPALPADEIAEQAQQAGLTAIQLHGGVNLALLQRLNELFQGRIKIIQTVHWQIDADDTSAAAVSQQLREIAGEGITQRVLIDSKIGNATGGTGIPFDWSAAQAVFANTGDGLNLIVAGGLRPDNVAEAIHGLAPWGVDVASGVEESPGSKSPEKLAAFIKNARNSA